MTVRVVRGGVVTSDIVPYEAHTWKSCWSVVGFCFSGVFFIPGFEPPDP